MSEGIPVDKNLDSSLDLMHDGYLFIKNRTDRYQSDLFITHLLMQKVICMSGREAAEIFYDSERFERRNAVPKRIQKTLFGESAIQSMDGDAHIQRKLRFLSLMTPPQIKRLSDMVSEEWQLKLGIWECMDKIVLFDEAADILCRAVCRWAGVPLKEEETHERADGFSAMVDAFGAVGPRYRKGKNARAGNEKWLKEIIEDVRSGRQKPDEGSALYAMACCQEPNGNLLDSHMAAVELINVIRPVVAVATYIVFMALALYEHPECKEKLLFQNAGDYSGMFVQEVRRLYPFTPFLGARVKNNFVWKQCRFEKGTLVLLDVYGADHDPRVFPSPDEFMPERFSGWEGGLFDFIPQGGGDPARGHRCPGEGITTELMKTGLHFLVNKIDYHVPDQNLSYNLGRMPTLPKSGFIMTNIIRKKPLHQFEPKPY